MELDDGTRLISRVSVCATGVEYRRLGLPNEDKLFGAGVYYGAGASEAQLCGNEHVVIVGAGNSSGTSVAVSCPLRSQGEYRHAGRAFER